MATRKPSSNRPNREQEESTRREKGISKASREQSRIDISSGELEALGERYGLSTLFNLVDEIETSIGLEGVGDIEETEIRLPLRKWLELEESRPKVRVYLTKSGLEYVIKGKVKLGKHHAIGGGLTGLVVLAVHFASSHWEAILTLLR